MRYTEYLQTPQWMRLRSVAMSRADFRCEFCFAKAIDAHHVRYPKNVFNGDSPTNLVAVCRRCHQLSHGIRPGYAEQDFAVHEHNTKNDKPLTKFEQEINTRKWLLANMDGYTDEEQEYLSVVEHEEGAMVRQQCERHLLKWRERIRKRLLRIDDAVKLLVGDDYGREITVGGKRIYIEDFGTGEKS